MSRSEIEYRAMPHTACELMWIKSLLTEIRFPLDGPMTMYCDNQVAIYITSPVFHERTKHIEVDCHFIKNIVLDGWITTPYISSSTQLAYV